VPDRYRARFGDLERAVLDALWGAGPEPRGADAWLTVREVHAVLSAHREVAYTTVMTVLDRMAVKGLGKSGRTNQYRAVEGRGVMTAGLMRDALGEFGEADRRTALRAFVDDASEEDRRALRDALAELERRSF
jgi:predicted transcriptional regulator